MDVYFAKFNQGKRRGELILMNSRNHVHKSAVEAGKQVAVIVVAALALTLPLRSQQSAIGDSSEAPGSVSQAATAASKQTHQVDLDPTAVEKRIEQPADKSPLDPSTIALDDGPPAVPSSTPGNPDPQQTAPAKVTYLSPAESAQKRSGAPGMKVKLIGSGEGSKQYAVIFSAGDEAYSGLLDFAEKYHVTSAHFTAIGALSRVVLGWLDPQKKMYRENPIDEQVEVATMIGDFALYQGKPTLHTHIVVGRRDGTANGGHLIEAIVSPTLEVFVTVDPVPLQKKYDPTSHLTLIDADSQ